MRVIQVLHQFLPKAVAGVEIYTYNLSAELSKRHEVYIYCREEGFFQREFHEIDDKFKGLPVRRIYFNLTGWKANPINQFLVMFRNRTIEQSLERFLEQVKPDVVHIQHLYRLSASLISVARRQGIPVVVTLHDYWFICPEIRLLRPNLEICSGPLWGLRCSGCIKLSSSAWISSLLRPLTTFLCVHRAAYMGRCLKEADLLIAPCPFLKSKFVEHGFSPDKILVFRCGIDSRPFQNFRKRESNKLRFGYMGTIHRHKGVHILVEAFNRVDCPEVELKVFGDPSVDTNYFAEVQAQAAPNPKISFLGRYNNSDLGHVLSEIDVLIVPSIWHELGPLTIREAFAAKVPVIASKLGAMPDLVEDGVNGLLVKPGDADDLLTKMNLLIEGRDLIKQFQSNIGTVESIKENAQELERIYRGLIGAR